MRHRPDVGRGGADGEAVLIERLLVLAELVQGVPRVDAQLLELGVLVDERDVPRERTAVLAGEVQLVRLVGRRLRARGRDDDREEERRRRSSWERDARPRSARPARTKAARERHLAPVAEQPVEDERRDGDPE